jgi:hypothetical protein
MVLGREEDLQNHVLRVSSSQSPASGTERLIAIVRTRVESAAHVVQQSL